MKTEFIPYEQALELKELGFEAIPIGGTHQGSVFYYQNGKLYYDGMPMYSSSSHNGQILAPLYQQAFRWFREKYGMLYTIEENLEDDQVWYEWDVKSSNGFEGSFEATYEEAELACLIKLIEITKNK